MFNPAPNRLEDVVDANWLTAMFAARWPDAIVRSVHVTETLITQATKVRLVLDVAGGAADLPRHICIKGILTQADVPSTASIVETRFYQDCAAALPVRVPRCIHAGLNAAGDNGVIVMEDLTEAGASFCTALSPFTVDETATTLGELARLHAAGWHDRPLFALPWLSRFLDQIGASPIMPQDRLQAMLDGPKGDPLPGSIKDAERLVAALQTLASEVRIRPSCLVHGDAHAGNIFRDRDGFGLVDWQILQKGEWAQDVAYHIAAVLTPEARRAHERTLLDHYRAELRAAGGPDLEREEAWARYRAALLYGYFLWVITQKVEPAITLEFVRRLGLAVADHGSMALLSS